MAVFANPKVAAVETYPPLPAAQREAPSIARRYPRSLLLRGNRATAERFRLDAARYDIVQFSGHAHVDDAEPWKSALMFDVPLLAREIGAMQFSRTKLVILGACSTLANDGERVEGTSPIARSFLTAGVPTVIGSLWDVDDAEAAVVMTRLHERLARGVTAVTALRDVQRELIHTLPRGCPASTWAALSRRASW